jgi:hypothetical protein
MQEKEYAQVYELGLGSLIGDFFQNVKDTVTGVAKAVAPIAPYVLPFVAPGIGSLVGGKLGSFLAIATSGIQGALSDRSGNIGQRFMSGVTGKDLPSVREANFANAIQGDIDSGNLVGNVGAPVTPPPAPEPTFMDRFKAGLNKQFNPFERTENPKFNQLKLLGIPEEKIIASGISPEVCIPYL